jgi:hypothetical protein
MTYFEANKDLPYVRILKDLEVTGSINCTTLVNEGGTQSVISIPPVSKPFVAMEGAPLAATVSPAVRFPPNYLTGIETEIYDTDYGRGKYTVTTSESTTGEAYTMFKSVPSTWRANSYSSTTGLYSGSFSTTQVDGSNTVLGAWMTMQCTLPFTLQSYSITYDFSLTFYYPTSWVILGSLDGINWYTVHTKTGATFTNNVAVNFTVTANTAYTYYRLIITKSAFTSTAYRTVIYLKQLVFYSTFVSDAYINANTIAMSSIDVGDDPSNPSFTGVYKISTYLPSSLVSFDTSSFPNTLEISQYVQGLLDESSTITWNTRDFEYSSQADGTPASITIESPVAFKLLSYAITQTDLAYEAPSKWNVYNSTNGTDWVLIDSRTGETNLMSTKRTFSISMTVTASKFHKFEMLRSSADILIGSSITENVTARTTMESNIFVEGTLIDSLLDVVLAASGSGTSSTNGFKTPDLGKYLSFKGSVGLGETRYIQLLPLPLGSNAVVTIYVIQGTGSNGGSAPLVVDECLIVEFSVDNGTTYFNAGTIAPITMGDGWQIMSLALPTMAASSNTFLRISQYNADTTTDNYGVQYINVSGLDNYFTVQTLVENPTSLETVGSGTLVDSLTAVSLEGNGTGTGTTGGFITSDSGKYFRFSGSATTRYIQLKPLSLGYTTVSIYVIRGTGTNGGYGPNVSNEGLNLEYSLDGVTYTSAGVIASYNLSSGWQTKSLKLPIIASSSNTYLRITQNFVETTTDNFGVQSISVSSIARNPYQNKISIAKLNLFTVKDNATDLVTFSGNNMIFGANIGIGTTSAQNGFAASIHNSSLKLMSTFDKPALMFVGERGERRPVLATSFSLYSGIDYTTSSKIVPFPPGYFTTDASAVFRVSLYGTGTYIVTASGQFNTTYLPQYAFNDATTHWRTLALYHGTTGYTGAKTTITTNAGSINGEWIQLQTPNTIIVNRYDITASTVSTTYPKTWYLVGSIDGTTWTSIDNQTNITWSSSEKKSFSFSSTTAYNRYRLIITQKSGTSTTLESIYVNLLSFFSEQTLTAKIPKAIDSASLINGTAPTSAYIIETDVGVSIDTTAFPVTATVTTVMGLLDSDYSSFTKWESKERLYTATSDGVAANITLQMPNQAQLLSYSFQITSYMSEGPSKWNLYASNDKIAWVLLESKSNIVWYSPGETRVFTLAKSSIEYEYKYHRFEFLRNNSSSPSQLSLTKMSLYVNHAQQTSMYGNGSGLEIVYDDTDNSGTSGLFVSNNTSVNKSQAIVLGSAKDSSYVFIQGVDGSSTANIVMNAQGGVNNYVGIGTTSPTSNLHVNGGLVITGNSRVIGSSDVIGLLTSDNALVTNDCMIVGRLKFGTSASLPIYQSYFQSYIGYIIQPSNYRYLTIEMWGAGGGGGAGAVQATLGTTVGTAVSGGGGGGSGAYGSITLPFEVASLGTFSIDAIGVYGQSGSYNELYGSISTTTTVQGTAGSAGSSTTLSFDSTLYSCTWTVNGGAGGAAGGASITAAGGVGGTVGTPTTFDISSAGRSGGAGGASGAGSVGGSASVINVPSGGGGGGGVPANLTSAYYSGGHSGTVFKPMTVLTVKASTVFGAGADATGLSSPTSLSYDVTGSGATGGGGGLSYVTPIKYLPYTYANYLSYRIDAGFGASGSPGAGGGGGGSGKDGGYTTATGNTTDIISLYSGGGGYGGDGLVRVTFY